MTPKAGHGNGGRRSVRPDRRAGYAAELSRYTQMTIFNLGSINIDYIYTVPHLVTAGNPGCASFLAFGQGGKSIALPDGRTRLCRTVQKLMRTGWLIWLRPVLCPYPDGANLDRACDCGGCQHG